MTIIAICLVAYLLGSIPFGLILTRVAGLGDIRQIGSGNIGATNVLRTGKKSIAAAVLLLDALKGTFAVLLAIYIAVKLTTADTSVTPDWAPFASGDQFVMAAALLALLGHMYPVWLKFKGGKGVATALGIWFALSPYVFLGMIVIWLLGALITRMSSSGAVLAMLALPVLVWFIVPPLLPAALLTMALVLWRHRSNINRIAKGTEPKIGKSKDPEEKSDANG